MIDPDLFRSVLGRFASSVTVLSARDAAGRDHGMTVSAFSSVSLDPPLVLVCIDRTASIFPTLQEIEWIGISILADHQESCSRRFAEKVPDAWLDGPPVVTGFASGRPKVEEIVAYWPALIPKHEVKTEVSVVEA